VEAKGRCWRAKNKLRRRQNLEKRGGLTIRREIEGR